MSSQGGEGARAASGNFGVRQIVPALRATSRQLGNRERNGFDHQINRRTCAFILSSGTGDRSGEASFTPKALHPIAQGCGDSPLPLGRPMQPFQGGPRGDAVPSPG